MEQITFGSSIWSTEYWQYFGITYCEYSQYFEGLYSGYCLYSKFRGSILTAGTACTRGSVLLILPVFAVFRLPVLQNIQYWE